MCVYVDMCVLMCKFIYVCVCVNRRGGGIEVAEGV